MTLERTGWLLLLANLACSPSFDNTPESVPHDKEEGGAMHAERLEKPFLCGDPNRLDEPEEGVLCPDTRPALDFLLSCDNTGCHGNFNYTSSTTDNRKLWGNEGPSCYTCHGEKWDDN